MLHLRPELVKMEQATCVTPPKELYDYPDVLRFTPLSLKTPNATVGDATLGTAEKGKRIVEKCVDRIVAFMNEKWEI